MDSQLQAALANGIKTSPRQIEKAWSDVQNYTAANQIHNISFVSSLGAPASFVRIRLTVGATANLFIKKQGIEEFQFQEGLTLNAPLLIRDENVEWIRVERALFPYSFVYYASGYVPAVNEAPAARAR